MTHILKDGEQYGSPQYHRHVLAPGDSTDNEEAHIAAAATAVWTPENIRARTAEVVAAIREQKAEKKKEIDELQIEIDREKKKRSDLDGLKDKLPK